MYIKPTQPNPTSFARLLAVLIGLFFITACAGSTFSFGEGASTSCTDITNLSNPACEAERKIKADDLLAFCSVGVNASDTRCEKPVRQYPCLLDPFNLELDCGTEFTSVRESRIDFCTIERNSQNPNCVAGLLAACDYDPFLAVCDDVAYGNAQTEHAITCSAYQNINHPRCARAVALRPCILTPFSKECVRDGGYQLGRTLHNEFCAMEGNASLGYCTAAILNDGCILNPFGAGCETGYETGRDQRVAFCSVLANAGSGLCAGQIVAHICDENPLGVICNLADYADDRSDFIESCSNADSVDDPACASVFTNPTGPAWAQSFAVPLVAKQLPNLTQNGFIFDKFDTNPQPDGWTARYDSVSIEYLGNIEIDVYYYHVQHEDGTRRYYAGLDSESDLGGLLPERAEDAPLSATWDGILGVKIDAERDNDVHVDFLLDVDFEGKKVSGVVDLPRTVEAGGLNGSFALDGGFDELGVITGRAEHRRYSSQERAVIVSGGQMSGLIGALGAVGAFVSDEGARQGFAGGFVAVNY
ncbi:MAG: hypothetical protein ACNYPD_07055 [Candidatus Halichondribacter symbioticus]